MPKKIRPASRYDDHGEWICMGTISNYVMARRFGAFPRVFSRRDWDRMARSPLPKKCEFPMKDQQ